MVKPETKNYNLKLKSNLKYRSYQFSLSIIKFVSNFLKKKIYWITGDQLLRSATSIGANIIEAQCSSSKKEFARYYGIALKSANETKYWLGLLKDGKLVDERDVRPVLNEAREIANMLGSSLLTIKGKKKL